MAADRKLARCATILDLAHEARRRLPGFVFDFLEGGAGDDAGVDRNFLRLHELQLMPAYLTGLRRSALDPSVRLFGTDYALPFGIAPTGGNGLIWPEGDIHLAKAAKALGIPLVNSTMGTASLEDVAALAPGTTWFQLYSFNDEATNADIIARADAAGVDVFVITVDANSTPNRNRDTRNRFGSSLQPDLRKFVQMALRPAWLTATTLAGAPSPKNLVPYNPPGAKRRPPGKLIKTHADWDDLRVLRQRWKGHLVVKGLLSGEDARRAADIGCDGVWISNHGGRVFESAPATVDCIAAVVAAVDGRARVLVDGGFYTGEDIVKAIALGADMVFLGRGPLYGLAAGGAAGVDRALQIYKNDVERTMLHLGCATVADLGSRNVLFAHGSAPPASAERGGARG